MLLLPLLRLISERLMILEFVSDSGLLPWG